MKTFLANSSVLHRSAWVISLSALLFVCNSARADEPAGGAGDTKKATQPAVSNKAAAAPAKKQAASEKKKVVSTGSQIPRKVRDYRSVAAQSISPLYIIDQEQIQHSGAATVAGVLRKTAPLAR